MGAENSVLEGCKWNDPIESSLPWTISPVVKSDGAMATVFRAKLIEKKDGDLLKKNCAILRGIRHPNIIRYIGGGETRDDIWLATEIVTPLVTSMSELTFDEICVGLDDILQAVNFLHSTLGMSHNNLCVSSLFMGHDGTWKLGELQHACKFSDATQAFLDQCRAFRKENSLAPEEKAGAVKLDPSIGHARDMFAFGAVLEALLENLREKDDRVKELEHQAVACLSVDPFLRPTAVSLLKLHFLRTELFEIIDFLKNVTMKSEKDKKDFFSTIVPRLDKLPQVVIARRLVIPLLARFVLLDESADYGVIPHLLTPKTGKSPHGLLNEDLFRQYVIPQLYNIFHVHDCHIRLILLQHFSRYVHLFSQQQLEDDIFLQILLGVRDSDDRVVAASLRALADLVPIMGGDVVVGAARKPFFFHGLPKQVSAHDIAKMSTTPQNITTILSSHKPNLSSHKPLLKDLAAGSVSAIMKKKEATAEENERKTREREQRREEAKLKREEKKKRLKEKLTDKEDDGNRKQTEAPISGLTIEKVARQESVDQDTILSEDVSNEPQRLDKNLPNGDLNTNNSNEDIYGSNHKDFGDQEEAPDWSDWEDADQKIEKEIEEELRQMSDGSETGESKVQTSPNPYRKSSPTVPGNVSWDSDVPEAERGLEMPGFGHETTDTHLDNKHKNSICNSNSNTVKTAKASKSLKLSKSPKASPTLAASSENAVRKIGTKGRVKATQSAKNFDDLGAGLDIKSVEIKQTQPELDFFADMAPSIQLTSKASVSDQPKDPGSLQQKTNININLFAVSAAAEEVVHDDAGWGDEDTLDWDAEGF